MKMPMIAAQNDDVEVMSWSCAHELRRAEWSVVLLELLELVLEVARPC